MGAKSTKPSSARNQHHTSSLHDNLVVSEKRKVEENYDIQDKPITKGKSTQIIQGTSKRYTKTKRSSGVAIKLFDGKSELPPPDLQKEADILSQCDHPNIVKLYEVAKGEKSGGKKNRISLVLELCRGGSVVDRMPYTEKQVCHIMRQLCSAVAYLHSKNIVHRDLDLSNIMYETEDMDSDIKLIDFGSAVRLELVPDHPGAFRFLKEKTGSVHIMAPEVIKGRYGPKADVWSLGICAYMLLQNGDHPIKASTMGSSSV